jgi:phosphatidylinositol 3-kinase
MDRLEKLVKKHDAGDIQPVDWLDSLAFRQIERIHQVGSESRTMETNTIPKEK